MVNNATHVHIVRKWHTQPFQDCVAPDWCTPEAHGHITDVVECRCGAIKLSNINGPNREIGPWQRATEERSHE
jgi:hypothetical protein